MYGDLSAMSGYNAFARDEDYAVEFINEFQDRLLFGTDICAPDQPVRLPDLLKKFKESGKISGEVFEKLAKINTERLLGL